MDAISSILVIAGILLALGAVFGLTDRRNFRPAWLFVAVLLIVVNDALLTNLYGALPRVVGDGDWNWQGKLLALIATFAIAAHPTFGWHRSGLTLTQHREGRAVTWAVAALFVALFIVIGLLIPDEPFDAGTLAFQATMPGLEEEAFYRGILLLAFDQALRGRVRVLGISIGWGGLLVTLAFGFAHSLSWEEGALAFDAMSFGLTAFPSLVLLWFRERTGSILLPVLMHNVANTFPIMF